MGFQQQLREWLSDCWEDFWSVPPRQVGIALLIVAGTVLIAAWRIGSVLHRPAWPNFTALWPVRLALVGAVLFFVSRLRRS